MSLNTAHADHGVLIHAGEWWVIFLDMSDDCVFSFRMFYTCDAAVLLISIRKSSFKDVLISLLLYNLHQFTERFGFSPEKNLKEYSLLEIICIIASFYCMQWLKLLTFLIPSVLHL